MEKIIITDGINNFGPGLGNSGCGNAIWLPAQK